MLAQYEPVCYELLRPAQVKARRAQAPIAYVVAGSLEWHGFQNPLGTDSLKAHAICCEAALKYGGVVLPPFYQGLLGASNWGPEGWGGYTLSHNESDMFQAAMLGVVRALVHGEWRVIVGVTGHDVPPQRDAMQRAIDEGTAGTEARGFALMEGELHEPDDDLPVRMDHAGSWETSCMLHAQPGKVDLETLRDKPSADEERWEMKGPEGVGGMNPLKYSSAELGRKIVARMSDLIGRKAHDLFDELKKAGP